MITGPTPPTKRKGAPMLSIGTRRPKRPVWARNWPVRRVWWVTSAVLVLIASALAWLLFPAASQPPAPRARQYLAFTACLLTGERGIADPAAEPAWAGLQDASLATRIKVEYLPIVGPQNINNAVLYINTLTQRHCNVIVAVKGVPSAAVMREAPAHPDTVFYVFGADTGAKNVITIDDHDPVQVRKTINHLIGTAATT
jgi:hypothetical protein